MKIGYDKFPDGTGRKITLHAKKYATATAAYDAAAYAAERKLQAEWIRKNITFPLK